jgi:PKD domain
VYKRIAALCLVVCAALALPVTAGAAPTWLAPVSFSQPEPVTSRYTDTAMGAGGGAAVAWQYEGAHKVIQASTKQPLGGFGPLLNVSPPEENSYFPQVAEDAAGDATVVWFNNSGPHAAIEAATIKAGIPSAPVQLSDATESALYPTVAMNDRGDTAVAWQRSDGTNEIAQMSFRPAGGVFSPPVSLSAPGQDAIFPRVAIDAAGDVTVAWARSNGTHQVAEAITRSAATGTLSAVAPLSDATQSVEFPVVAMDGPGDTVVAWQRHEGSDEIVQALTRPAGGGFGPVANVSEVGADALYPEVAMDGHGDPSVVWYRNSGVQIATGTPSGSFAKPQTIAFPAIYPDIAEDTAGDTLVGFYSAIETPSAGAVYRPAGGNFSGTVIVSPPEQHVSASGPGDEDQLRVGIDGSGNGVFGFATEASGHYIAGASLLDAAGPELDGLSIPATATAGTPVTFSVTPAARISSVAGTTWSFGDTSTASGASVTHTFASAGTYAVSVTSTDANGNTATQSGRIVVAPAPPTPPPPFAGPGLLSSSVTLDSHGHLKLKVSCPASSACGGTLTLTTPATAKALAASGKSSFTKLTLLAGRASFSAAAGASTTVTVSLAAPVRSLLAKRRQLALTATLDTHDDFGQSTSTSRRVIVKARAVKKKARKKKR